MNMRPQEYVIIALVFALPEVFGIITFFIFNSASRRKNRNALPHA